MLERTRPGTKLTAIAVAGQLVAVEGPDRFTVHTVADRREVTSERGGEGRVVALRDGRFLLQSSQGVARLYALRGEECELVASLNEPIMGAWEEGGVLYANLSVDRGTGARKLEDLVRTYRIVGIDDLYPAAWKD